MSVKGAVKDVVRAGRRLFKTVTKKIAPDSLYNYETVTDREDTIAYLLQFSAGERETRAKVWDECEDYYNNAHAAQEEFTAFCEEEGAPDVPAVIPDPYIHCESQITPELPDFEFRGRDDDQDGAKARIRQHVVQYVVDNNDMETRNTSNERRLVKFGDAIWKVGFDDQRRAGRFEGDIFVLDVPVYHTFPDPVAVDFDSQEYHGYAYPMHRIAAQRKFARELERKKVKDIRDLGANNGAVRVEMSSDTANTRDDTVLVVEWWFRQPRDGREKMEYEVNGEKVEKTVEWEAGDIACSILVNETEVKYIPLYWRKTHLQNKMYPFSKYSRVPKEDEYWGVSEIEPIKELVDAADRELGTCLLNDTFMGNDIILYDEQAKPDDAEWDNKPGSKWPTKNNMSASVRRLGGLTGMHEGAKATISMLREIIKQTTGNFDVNMGDAPPGNVDTLGGLLTLQEQGNRRQSLKRIGRKAGFERLYRLIDYTAIEFYDEKRTIFLGAKGKSPDAAGMPAGQGPNMDRTKGAVMFEFSSEDLKARTKDREGRNIEYYPIVDCVIDIGEGVQHNTAVTVRALETLAGMNVNPQNYLVVLALIDKLQLPDRKLLREFYEGLYGPKPVTPANPQDAAELQAVIQGLAPEQLEALKAALEQLPPEERAAIEQDPRTLLEFIQEQGLGGTPNGMPGGGELTPEEEAMLRENPELIEQAAAELAAGGLA